MISKVVKAILDDITENILCEAQTETHGAAWRTIFRSVKKGVFEKNVSYGLGQGSLGIAFFLLHYYKHFPDSRLLNVIKKALFSAYTYFRNDSASCGFYYGRGGVIYVLSDAYEILGDRIFLEQATELVIRNHNSDNYSLSHGYAGLLVSATRLYVLTGNSDVLIIIEDLISKIVKGSKIHSRGIYWDEYPSSSRPANGFLNGGSGVAFALIQASNVVKDPHIFDKFIEEAIRFEDHTYRNEFQNWPDFINEDYYIFNYKRNQKLSAKRTLKEAEFTRTANTISWALGSPGMLLVRSGESAHYARALASAQTFFEKNQHRANSDYTLYKGIGGLAVTMAHLNNDVDGAIMLEGLQAQKKKYKHYFSGFSNNREYVDLSLFRGDAGIGYALIFLFCESDKKTSVLFPALVNIPDSIKKLELSQNSLHGILLDAVKWMPAINLQGDKSFYTILTGDLPHGGRNSSEMQYHQQIRMHMFELLQKEMTYSYVSRKLQRQRNIAIRDVDYISISQFVRQVVNGNDTFLLHRIPGRVNVVKLVSLASMLLRQIECRLVAVKDIEDQFIALTEARTAGEIVFVKEKVRKIITQFVQEGVLEVVTCRRWVFNFKKNNTV